MADKVKILEQYLPPAAAPIIAKWIDVYQTEFKISRTRTTKLGDYRSPFKGENHKISVNYNLNPYAFLVTTVHEFAHLLTYNQHKNKAKPHGDEWKNNFKLMMQPFFELDVFPETLKKVLVTYLQNPAASSCSDVNLVRILKQYDQIKPDVMVVEKLPTHALFKLKNGREFKKLERIRKRYRCIEIKTGREYLFNPLAEVYIIDGNEI